MAIVRSTSMDQTLLTRGPFFDAEALRARLTGLWKEQSSLEGSLRAAALQVLEQVVAAIAPKACPASKTNSSASFTILPSPTSTGRKTRPRPNA